MLSLLGQPSWQISYLLVVLLVLKVPVLLLEQHFHTVILLWTMYPTFDSGQAV